MDMAYTEEKWTSEYPGLARPLKIPSGLTCIKSEFKPQAAAGK